MKKKYLIPSLLSIVTMGVIIPITTNDVINTPNLNVNTKNTIITSDQKWIDSIKESAQNTNTIKIFFTRNASLTYQQSLIALFYMLSLDTTQPINVNNSTVKPISFFIDFDVKQNDNKFDFSELETNNNNNNNILFVKSTKDITGVSYSNDEKYWATPTQEQTQNIFEYYKTALENNNSLKIDIWAADLTISPMFSNCKEQMLNLMPYINKFYVLSDGNAQTFKFAPKYVSNFKKGIISNLDDVKRKWDILKNKDYADASERQQIMKKSIFQDFLKLENDIVIFHTLDYTDSPYWGLSKQSMYNVYVFNIDYYDMATKLDITDQSKKNKYINDYQKYFKITQNKFSDFVELGYEYYDKSKKNLVWMGDNLIQSKTTKYTDEEIAKIFLGFTKKYPANEYNYFFKHHPGYIINQQVALTGKIIQLSNIKPIIFKNFGWELFLAWDSYQQGNSSNALDYTPFFSNPNGTTEQQTTLIGLQYSTTVILTTYSHLINKFNFTEEQAYKYVSASNFPTVGTYTIAKKGVVYDTFNYNKVVKANNIFLQDIYMPYKNFYNLYQNYSVNSKDFLKPFDLKIESLNEMEVQHKFKIATFTLLIFMVIIVIYLLISIFVYLNLNKKMSKSI